MEKEDKIVIVTAKSCGMEKKVISKEEKEDNKLTMICYLGTFNWNIAKLKTKSYEEVEKLYLSMNPPKGLINQPILSSDVEEVLRRMKTYELNITKRLNPGGVIKIGATILNDDIKFLTQYIQLKQKALSDKDKIISELNEMLEITVIAEMLDLIKNGNPIPLTRKELQDKLNAIEEVMNTITINDMRIDQTKYNYDKIQTIKQILKGEIK